ncbi:MAG: hypothetical protein ABI641_11395 [Caldimonas sp.]
MPNDHGPGKASPAFEGFGDAAMTHRPLGSVLAMPQPSTARPLSTPWRESELARAEGRGKQVLLYAPHGPLGGVFACSRCGASELQPDLLDHRADCPYRAARVR